MCLDMRDPDAVAHLPDSRLTLEERVRRDASEGYDEFGDGFADVRDDCSLLHLCLIDGDLRVIG